ncbi:hypothetical protein JCM9279_006461 [Rhodotorula babjevae]
MSSTSRQSSSSSTTQMKPPTATATAGGKERARPSLSSSLVLLAPLSSRTQDGFDYRVLLLKRHAQSRTYDSAHVMPGGNIDPIDLDAEAWSSLFPPSTSPAPSTSPGLTATELQSLKICAVRETFEESGLLLLEPETGGSGASAQHAWNALPAEDKTRWREEVHKDGKRFLDLLKMLGDGAKPALSSLTHWSRWITPVILPRRFDTHFFIAVLPPSFSPASPHAPTHESLVSSDGVETSSADWLTPLEAIARAVAYTDELTAATLAPSPSSSSNAGPIILHPPQFNLMAELACNHRSLASLLITSTSSTDPATAPVVRPRRVVPLTPQIAEVVDGQGRERRATLLPGDAEYTYEDGIGLDEVKARVEADGKGKGTRRNRSYVLAPRKGQIGLTVEGCLRENVVDVLGEGWEDMRAGDSGRPVPKL